MGKKWPYAIILNRRLSTPAQTIKNYAWMRHCMYKISLLCVWMFTSIFGRVVEVKQITTKDRLVRKNYMGVWRWNSEMEARMMSKFWGLWKGTWIRISQRWGTAVVDHWRGWAGRFVTLLYSFDLTCQMLFSFLKKHKFRKYPNEP